MDKFDLKKYLAEGRLLKENNTQKIKVWRESYDKSPFNAVLIKRFQIITMMLI